MQEQTFYDRAETLPQEPPTEQKRAKEKAHKPRPSTLYVEVEKFTYQGEQPYTLRMTSGRTFVLQKGQSLILPTGAHSRYLAYKKPLFIKESY